jgi:hypothetical protein
MAESKTYKSKITRTSQYGFQLEETGDIWINYGKFYEGDKDLQVGENIILDATESNGKLYVNSIEGKSSKKADNDAIQGLVDDQSKADLERDPRQRLIVRQSCLRAAVDYVNIEDQATTQEVLSIAEKFEKWVMR